LSITSLKLANNLDLQISLKAFLGFSEIAFSRIIGIQKTKISKGRPDSLCLMNPGLSRRKPRENHVIKPGEFIKLNLPKWQESYD
jgi:hypothetical protein